MATKRLLPLGYGEDYSAAVPDQLKAWEAFCWIHLGWRENPPRPTGDVTPDGCPWADFHNQMSREPTKRPVVTAKSQFASSKTGAADAKLQQHPAIQLPKMEEEGLKSISSKGSTQPPRASTPKPGASSKVAETESMEVDPHAM